MSVTRSEPEEAAIYRVRELFRSVLFCALACVAIVIFAAIDIANERTLRQANLQVRTWRNIEVTTERMLGELRDAETGQRGYLLTRDESYLLPFQQAKQEVVRLASQLEFYTRTMPEHFAGAQQLASLAALKVDDLTKMVELTRSGNAAAALDNLKTKRSEKLTAEIGDLAGALDEAAGKGTQTYRDAADHATRDLVASIIATSVASISLLVLLTYSLRRDGQSIRETAEQLAITLRSIGDAVVTTDAHGDVTYLNPVAAELAQVTLPTATAAFQSLFNLVDERTGAKADDPIQRVFKDGTMTELDNRTALLRPDGTILSIEDCAAPLRDDNGEVRGVVFVFKDISGRRRTERELATARQLLESKLAQLRVTEEELRVADRRKDEFLATLAHELRNPLAPIRHAIKLLDNEHLGLEQQRWSRAVITRQATHIARLLDDLLDSARITRGELALRVADVDLRALITEALDVATPLIERKGHKLDLILPDRSVTLRVDGIRIAQVLSNLLTNAAKYTDNGGHITLEVKVRATDLLILVKDSGIGLSAESIPELFKMFNQIRSTRDRSEGGLGIGLSLAANLVRLHGGGIEVQSDGTDRGALFVVTLPASVVTSQAPNDPLPGGIPSAPAGGRRIVVIDDNEDAAASICMLLRQSNYTVRTAHTGADGVALARLLKPDALVIDIGLPDMDGYQVARTVRLEDWGRTALLIALTGWGQASDKQHAINAGFDHHLTKPADPDVLQGLIDRQDVAVV